MRLFSLRDTRVVAGDTGRSNGRLARQPPKKLPLPFYEESLKNFAVHPASAYAFTTWPVRATSVSTSASLGRA
jgi:hypothetical protein